MYNTQEDFKKAVKDWINDLVREHGISYTPEEFEHYNGVKSYDDGTTVKEVHRTGGEDEGSYYTVTFEIRNGEHVVYVKFSGWYQSFVGGEYEDWDFVTPRTKEIVVYE